MSVLLALDPLSRGRVEEVLLESGFERRAEIARTGAERTTAWGRGELDLQFETDMLSGVGVFLLGGDTALLAEVVSKLVRCETPSAALEGAARETRPGARARALLRLRFAATFKAHGLDRAAFAAFVRTCLHAPERGLRAAAVETLLELQWPELDAAVEGIATAHPDFAWFEVEWRRLRRENDAALEARRAAEAMQQRLASLPDRIRAGEWAEAYATSGELLADHGLDATVWEARARAAGALDKPWEAAFAAAAWVAVGGGDPAEELLAETLARAPEDVAALAPLALETLRALRDPEERERDTQKGLAMLEALAKRASVAKEELGFLFTVALFEDVPGRESVVRGADHFEPITKKYPLFAEGFCHLGHARIIVEDYDAGDAAYDTALRILEAGAMPSESLMGLLRFEHDLRAVERPFSPPTRASVLTTMRFMAKQRETRREAVVRFADRLLALTPDVASPEERFDALTDRAVSLTFLLRHDEAIEGYRRALEAEPKDRPPAPGLRFNLACELAKRGEVDEALRFLREAVALDAKYGADARDDDYFAALWDSADFIASTFVFDAPPTAEDADRFQTIAVGRFYRGESDDAWEASHRAVAAAHAVGGSERIARAWKTHGTILTYVKSPERGVAVLERALGLIGDGPPEEVADANQMLGAALHAASRLEEAKARYETALGLRRAHLGEGHPLVAKSLGELGRLASNVGAFDEADDYMSRAIAISEAFLATEPGRDEALESLVDVALNAGNRVAVAVTREAPRSVVNDLARKALDALIEVRDAGGVLPGGAARRLRINLVGALQAIEATSDAEQEETEGMLELAFELEVPNPVERAEKLYWMRLRAGVADLRAAGIDDAALARGFGQAIRGGTPEGIMGEHPVFAGLSVEFSRRLSARTDLVMVAMSLSMVESGAETLEQAIDTLEQLAIANALGVRGEGDEDEDEDDEHGEDEDDGDGDGEYDDEGDEDGGDGEDDGE